ncbi:MAG: MBL fold metallo-hydrolase [Proteobacteria bacterium]|nr:MBL fold metallo-hydrolase [Pseudomonadota bacterium]MDA0951627.1 MBL fold metallo-hydrolase [Pseudomonadota bacterium]MDA1069981.1 MBL fold metallo-hydrolase [Pseudomonadota bacterium]
MELTFWGVRGGMPAPGAATQRFGGNSPCIELRAASHLVIFDAGTGLRDLGRDLMARSPVSGDLLFSHTNFNRICGLPFFAAAFHPGNAFGFWCGHRPEEGSIKEVLTRLMTDPVFPVPIDIFNASLAFHDYPAGEAFTLGEGIAVSSLPISCGLSGTAYRLEHAGRSLGHACAVQMPADPSALKALVAGCDTLIMSLIEDEVPDADRVLAEFARDAGVGRLIVTDHAPGADDDSLERREAAMMAIFAPTVLAREGHSYAV